MLHKVGAVVIKAPNEALRAGDHVVEAGPDETEDDHQDWSVLDVIRVLTSPLGFDGGHVSADEDAGHDYHAMPAYG